MTFYAQFNLLAAGLAAFDCSLFLFKCDNSPGGCSDWDPYRGGNKSLITPTANCRKPLQTPYGVNIFDEINVKIREVYADDEVDDYDWHMFHWKWGRGVLGKVSGVPIYSAISEPPKLSKCHCGKELQFLLQLAEVQPGADPENTFRFLNGHAYSFGCIECQEAIWFWQE